jgi:hypothetical protein
VTDWSGPSWGGPVHGLYWQRLMLTVDKSRLHSSGVNECKGLIATVDFRSARQPGVR